MRANEAREQGNNGTAANNRPATTSTKLLAPDESTLSRLVAARLDLPISQRLLDKNLNYPLSNDVGRINYDANVSENKN